MTIQSELADLAEVVRDQVAQGIARDLAIKLLAGLVAQATDEDQFREVVMRHRYGDEREDRRPLSRFALGAGRRQ